MKVLVTAGTEGLGKEIVDYFAPDSLGISRRVGFDIRKSDDRSKIAELSLGFEIFVNHAYSKDESQNLLLQAVADLWISKKKAGFIFSTGSYVTHFESYPDQTYLHFKKQLDEISHSYSRRIEGGEFAFRMAVLRPGMLDTARSRKKTHWRGNGVRGNVFCQIIQFLYDLPLDVQIPDLVVESIVPR